MGLYKVSTHTFFNFFINGHVQYENAHFLLLHF